ncbi:hypothetical protein RHMOL_Rhmol06G0258900 [Rhododendron molle]|uniref:Uncharacterized protein n=1 Tax=Rhododendron molle TaxID=49168 RepID=A0ACC0NIM3_RHOML|nr:hypothetical protein RHMOL_Rhmol06G0258900 [Rhododendron molle]
MNIEEGKERGVTSTGYPPQPGVADYPPKPVVGFPQPGPPPVATYSSAPPPPPQFYADGNLAGPGPKYPVSEAAPAVREPDRLFCWGLGVGWFLFVLGFILGVFPWLIFFGFKCTGCHWYRSDRCRSDDEDIYPVSEGSPTARGYGPPSLGHGPPSLLRHWYWLVIAITEQDPSLEQCITGDIPGMETEQEFVGGELEVVGVVVEVGRWGGGGGSGGAVVYFSVRVSYFIEKRRRGQNWNIFQNSNSFGRKS